MTKPATAAATGRHDRHRPPAPGALGRLGSTMVARRRWVFGIWLIALVALGSAAPSVFSSLAGAGWQANGSESVQVQRTLSSLVEWEESAARNHPCASAG